MTLKEGNPYFYNSQGKGSKPHAVKSTMGPAGEVLYIYKYDAAGNMVEKRGSGDLQENLFYIPREVLNYDIYALEQLNLNYQAEIKTASGSYGAVGCQGQVQLGQNAKTGTISATGNVVLQDSSAVYGDIQTGGSVSGGSGVFVGGITYDQIWVNTPNITILNNIDFTGVSQTTTNVASGQSSTLAPGKYWNYNVSGNLNLTGGVYYFNSLQMHTGSRLNLDEATGPVKIYVQSTLLMMAGTFHSLAGKNGTKSLLIGYLGIQNVFMGGTAPFGGTVIAPRAILSLGNGNKVYEGMFIGKQVGLHDNTKVTSVPFVGLTPQIWHYKYDWNNKLVEVQHNYQTVMTSQYGVSGDRIKKSENGTDSYYYFAEYEEDWSGGTLTGSSKYLFANGKRVAKKNKDGQFSYYISDHLGSNSVIVDSNLNVVKTIKYLPYGATLYEEGTQMEDYRFNGKEQDVTGLYYYGSRFYDPDLGRFITADTATPGDGFDSQGLNRYSYCLNNPVKYVDPSGNQPSLPHLLFALSYLGTRYALWQAEHPTMGKYVSAGLNGLAITFASGVYCNHWKNRVKEGDAWYGPTMYKAVPDVVSVAAYEKWSETDWQKFGFDIAIAGPFGAGTYWWQLASKAMTTSKKAYTAVCAPGHIAMSSALQLVRDRVFEGKWSFDPLNFMINAGLQVFGAGITSYDPKSQLLKNISSISKKAGRQAAYSISEVSKKAGEDAATGLGIPDFGLEFQSDFNWTPDWMSDLFQSQDNFGNDFAPSDSTSDTVNEEDWE